jgi:hypothetical protein
MEIMVGMCEALELGYDSNNYRWFHWQGPRECKIIENLRMEIRC